ncbi:MAG: DNA-binding MarR family transcriptional regulator [Candidatus Azotimanducaceae bacterium]|jgi:DNA-binding MarR family transcriptional regulator
MTDYDEVLVSLRRITRAIDLYSKKLLKDTGLTTSQLLVMQSIGELENPTPSAIAKEVVLSQATVTNLIDRLERHQLVKRERSLKDKRTVKVSLTDRGAEIIDSKPELLQTGFLRHYRKLQEWERHGLVSALQRVATMMDAEDLDASPILELGELQAPSS